jgi:tRNA(Ile)-lysidine synthase
VARLRCLAADQNLIVRVREPGERFQPLGMNGRSAKVKEVMINRKIGARWRANWPIVAGPTHLIWLTGHALDERMKISKESTTIVQLTCYKG